MQELVAFIITSDKETGMNSCLPKYIHNICGQAMLSYTIDASLEAGSDKLVVVSGQNPDSIKESIPEDTILVHLDEESKDDNLIKKLQEVLKNNEKGTILILPGEYPTISGSTLKSAYEYHQEKNNDVTVLTNSEGSLSDICF